MSCIAEIDICVTRGDMFELDVGLADGWDEVVADPNLYRGALVFREEQDDTLPELLRQEVLPSTDTQDVLGEPPVYLGFRFTGAQTQTLPDYDIVAFCEIYKSGDPAGPMRVFNAKVKQHD